MLSHVGMTAMGLAAADAVLASVAAGGRPRSRSLCLWALTGAVLTGKFVVIGQSPGLAVVLGIALGASLWALLARCPVAPRDRSLFFVALFTYLLHALYPWRLLAEPTTVLALLAEWAQTWLPGRTAEVSSVVLALLMGLLVGKLARPVPFQKTRWSTNVR